MLEIKRNHVISLLQGVILTWNYFCDNLNGEHTMEMAMIYSFANGKMSKNISRSSRLNFQRTELTMQLGKIIFERTAPHSYSIITGPDGVGKSSAVVETILNMPFPRGVVYVNVVDATTFSRTLARLINFRYNDYDRDGLIFRVLSIFASPKNNIPSMSEEPMATWRQMMKSIADTAMRYKAKFGKSITLVIDAVDIIAEHDHVHGTLILQSLQEFGERQAETGVHVVFVAGDGLALRLMKKNPEFSRASVFEIGDISDDEAVSFLVLHNVSKDIATRAVGSYTGGRLKKIEEFLSNSATLTLDEMIRQDHTKLHLSLASLGLECDQPLFHLLLQDRFVNVSTMDWLKVSPDALTSLVAANILSWDGNTNYRFHHRSVETFFKMAREGKYPEFCAVR